MPREEYPKPEMKEITPFIHEVSKDLKEGMRVPARIYAGPKLMESMDNGVFNQVTNVATLPGIQKFSFCMPDAHWGYGFPIGGVAAFDPQKDGVISPGGIGFDINCGMRLMTTNLHVDEVTPKIKELVELLYKKVPVGVGCRGTVQLTREEFNEVITDGAQWCLKRGYATKDDIEHIEDNGKIAWANASKVSDKAKKRGFNQIGTLGSGNHYLEIQVD